MGILRETLELWRLRRLPRDARQIIFYSEHEGYYSYFEGIIRELTETRGMPIIYITSDAGDPILKARNPRVCAFYIKTFLPYFMALVKARVLVMTMPDLNQFHIRRSIHPVQYVYVFHALNSIHMVYREGAFDHYDTIFCVGPHQVAEIRARERQKNLPPKTLVEAGYWRLERIYQKWLVAKQHKPNTNKTVLIAPSWGEHNILKECGIELIDALIKIGYNVIVRPHPEMSRHMPEVVAALEAKYAKNARVRFEKSVSSDESILAADILVTDISGIALEYAFGTERPVLYIDVPPKVKNPHWHELGLEPLELQLREQIGVLVSPQDIGRIDEAIARLAREREVFAERIRALRAQYIFAFGKSSEIGARFIKDLVADKE